MIVGVKLVPYGMDGEVVVVVEKRTSIHRLDDDDDPSCPRPTEDEPTLPEG